jgi:polyisoprenyl-phosphate glycosyltransferase
MGGYLDKLLDLKKKDEMKISCIIPAYNEEGRISKVLEVVRKFPFDEVIVVNDGSIDKTHEVVESYISDNFKLITHMKNKGKTAAVLTGVSRSAGDLIVMIDADLIGLTHENIAKMIYLVLIGNYDLTILDRAGDRSAIWGWTNCARFFGGERCFWKKDFLDINLPKESGYLLEVMMNLHYINNNKKIRNIYCPNLFCVHQFDKIGKVKGYYNYFNMSVDIVKKATVVGFLKQVKEIEDDHKYLPEWNLPTYNFNGIQVTKYFQNIDLKNEVGNVKEKIVIKSKDIKERVERLIYGKV